jgi:hypothetical protein
MAIVGVCCMWKPSHRGFDGAMSGRERGFFARSTGDLLHLAASSSLLHKSFPIPRRPTPDSISFVSIQITAEPTGSFLDSYLILETSRVALLTLYFLGGRSAAGLLLDLHPPLQKALFLGELGN